MCMACEMFWMEAEEPPQAIKPGKPTVFGNVSGKPVLGMPGYPPTVNVPPPPPRGID